MGISSRDYAREDDSEAWRGESTTTGWLMTYKIIAVTVILYLIDGFTPKGEDASKLNVMASLLSLHSDWWMRPWQVYQLLTYGFFHLSFGSFESIKHVGFNMLGLWFAGRLLEAKLGSREFLGFYLASIVVSGLAWTLIRLIPGVSPGTVVGASGGVSAVVILFCILYARETVLLFGVIPMPAWLLGVIIVGIDFLSILAANLRLSSSDYLSGTAFDAHLAGAAFAAAYFYTGWQITGGWSDRLVNWWVERAVTRERNRRNQVARLDREADALLEKVHREGEGSLTPRERKILHDYSLRVRQKKS
jgi:membrane associated rhomboid family serine protease